MGNSENNLANKILTGCFSTILLTSTFLIVFCLYLANNSENQSTKEMGFNSINWKQAKDKSLTVYLAAVCLTNALCWLLTGLFYLTNYTFTHFTYKFYFKSYSAQSNMKKSFMNLEKWFKCKGISK